MIAPIVPVLVKKEQAAEITSRNFPKNPRSARHKKIVE